jgi:hypothetical protein
MYTSGGISIQQVAKTVVRKLRNTQIFQHSDPELIDIMMVFESIDELAKLDDYKSVLELLYAYGDKQFQLWVEAEHVDPQDSATEIAPKTKALFENEDTKPDKVPFKPYLVPGGASSDGWVKHKFPDIKIELWDKSKIYKAGDLVIKGTMKYKCKIDCSNIDPTQYSFNKAGDAWDYLGIIDKNPSDPERVFKDRLTCSIPATGRNYGFTRKHHYMSEEDFNRKLHSAEIDPATMPKDLYTYMKDCEEPYQEWLMARWHKHNLTFKAAAALNN